jgi:hypothetical protein
VRNNLGIEARIILKFNLAKLRIKLSLLGCDAVTLGEKFFGVSEESSATPL